MLTPTNRTALKPKGPQEQYGCEHDNVICVQIMRADWTAGDRTAVALRALAFLAGHLSPLRAVSLVETAVASGQRRKQSLLSTSDVRPISTCK